MIGWAAVLSMFPDKRPRYALVLYPAMAWIAGVRLATRNMGAWRGRMGRAARVACGVIVVGGVVLALVPIRVQRPPDPGWAAMFEFLDALPDRPVVAAGLATNEQARWYLRDRTWPGWIGSEIYPTLGDVPADALLVWTADGAWQPSERQRVVLSVGRVRVTEFVE